MNETEWENLPDDEKTKEIIACMKMFRNSFSDEDWKEMEKQAELDVQ